MELHGIDRSLPMAHPLVCAIVRVEEPRLPFLRQCFLVYSETMILRCNIATLGAYLNARLVLTTMAILQLEGVASGGKGQELMSQADSKNRDVSPQSFSEHL